MIDIKKGRREAGRKTEAGAGNGGGYGRRRVWVRVRMLHLEDLTEK